MFLHLHHAGFVRTNTCHTLFLEEEKQKETIKIIPPLAFILVPKSPKKGFLKKVFWVRKG
jgi:hypothetical protein